MIDHNHFMQVAIGLAQKAMDRKYWGFWPVF
jgi:hypothetical protein